MLKALLAGAAVTLALAAGPALAQSTIKAPPGGAIPMGTPIGPTALDVLPSEPVTPAERAQVRRDWNEMDREYQQRQRTGIVPPQGSVGVPTAGGSAFGGNETIAPSQGRPSIPASGTGLQGLPQEPMTPAERAQVRRDWNEMDREYQQRQRSGVVPPQGSIGTPTAGGSSYGGTEPRIAPSRRIPRSSIPASGTSLQGLPQEPMTPAERAQVRRDWNEMDREWQQRQRSGTALPPGTVQPPLPDQR